ncbi:hypothetical protein [Sphingomonas sp. PAMC 26617]|uniref:hypothetical protein n=1 Tax=Sphingomonas sp. PAMC 26617 TaxID=1112216 RepID=UPI0002888967|nr:hypothetical protein [Sphingomonas sp. PAMC 26617]
MKRFFTNWAGGFGDGVKALRALPWLVAGMIALELVQHVIEVHTGFFSLDPAVRKAASLTPVRMALGWPKMVATWALAFFAVRFLVLDDARAALRVPALAWRRYAGVVVFQLVPALAIIYAEPILAALGTTPTAPAVMGVRLVFGLGQQLLEPLLLLWFVNAAIGTTGFGPVASARATGWWYFVVLLMVFVTRLPFNAAHQALNRYAMGQSAGVMWGMLALDAVLVSIMVVMIAAVQLRAAGFVAERRGVRVLAEVARGVAVA